ncbi:hypothetical protein GCM10010166_21460 [Couchioplanes caeruleus subsp. azureus]|nr:DUF1348 family protein [Couchioplanes caeruleus]GGQ52213.1 hypothetical protein GCM10010166_21460 [Couchioplanes caeruleus subsp. azureus]
MTAPRPPLPPFTAETARIKVQAAEDAWNTRDPARVAAAYTPDSVWRNRDIFLTGRAEIEAFLARKWARERGYALRKELWAFDGNRSRSASHTNGTTTQAAGGAATATNNGSSTPTAT